VGCIKRNVLGQRKSRANDFSTAMLMTAGSIMKRGWNSQKQDGVEGTGSFGGSDCGTEGSSSGSSPCKSGQGVGVGGGYGGLQRCFL
jgi:hypothetical protein